MKADSTEIDLPNLRHRILGCWLGKAVGGTLGMPYEGDAGPLSLCFYDPVPETMVANDDLDLQILWACLLDRMKSPRVSLKMFENAWRDHITFPWDEYGVCKRNLRLGFKPPDSGAFDNWFANGMGAAIRSEIWACLAPGDPPRAAQYARMDACLDHAGDGLWAEVFFAAAQSRAFAGGVIREILQVGLEQLPSGSMLTAAITDTFNWWDSSHDWRRVRGKILERYGHENFTQCNREHSFTVLGCWTGMETLGAAFAPQQIVERTRTAQRLRLERFLGYSSPIVSGRNGLIRSVESWF